MSKKNFNRWFSKPVTGLLILVMMVAMSAIDSLMDNGYLVWGLIGMFAPMGVMWLMHKRGLMEWIDRVDVE